MKPSSRKAKGRALQNDLAQAIGELVGVEPGPDSEVASRPMGQAGADIVLKGEGFKGFPFFVEAKNQERWNVPSWAISAKVRMEEEREEGRGWRSWLLVLRRSRRRKRAEVLPDLVVMEWEAFLSIWKELLEAKGR